MGLMLSLEITPHISEAEVVEKLLEASSEQLGSEIHIYLYGRREDYFLGWQNFIQGYYVRNLICKTPTVLCNIC